MTLSVPAHLLEDARRGRVLDHDFVDCVRTSLPYAYATVARLAGRLAGSDRPFVDNQDDQEAPPDEATAGELLRAMSSDAIRGALERYFNVVLAFQNCHRVAVFPPRGRTSREYRDFTSVESLLLNQRPELVNC